MLVGHDWGATIAATSALTRPDVFRAVGLPGVQYSPPGGPRPSEVFARMGGDEEFYVSYFQQPGRAGPGRGGDRARCARLARGLLCAPVRRHPARARRPRPALRRSRRHTGRERFPADQLPAWLGEGDLDVLAGEFERTGMSGALNRYRNMDRDRAKALPKVGR